MKATQKQISEDYHIACQNCGTTNKPLHIIPLRDEVHVVGLIHSCDDCDSILKGCEFSRDNAQQTDPQAEARERYERTVDLLMTDEGFGKHCDGLTVNSVIKVVAKLASGMEE